MLLQETPQQRIKVNLVMGKMQNTKRVNAKHQWGTKNALYSVPPIYVDCANTEKGAEKGHHKKVK